MKDSINHFETFKKNVMGWAEDRGIYEFSTAKAQMLKTLSETGELADAIIKNDKDGIKDAIGDVAVCVINYAKMEDQPIEMPVTEDGMLESPSEVVGEIAITIGSILASSLNKHHFNSQFILSMLLSICQLLDTEQSPVVFSECCDQAWNEIKDRTGRMVAGGAFVKDE